MLCEPLEPPPAWEDRLGDGAFPPASLGLL